MRGLRIFFVEAAFGEMVEVEYCMLKIGSVCEAEKEQINTRNSNL